MSGSELWLLAVAAAFVSLLLWVYSPGRRQRLESYGAIPLDEDERNADAPAGRDQP